MLRPGWPGQRIASTIRFWPGYFAQRKAGSDHPTRKSAKQKMSQLNLDPQALLYTAIAEARTGLQENGIPIGAAIFDATGKLLCSGHNRRMQHNDPSAHGETDAFRNAGRQRSYRDKIMVTTLAPCWYCSGLIRQFNFRTVIVGESRNFQGGIAWLKELGITVVDLNDEECVHLLSTYIKNNPSIWNEDIGESL
jgi:cytosine/creatinine deaminase